MTGSSQLTYMGFFDRTASGSKWCIWASRTCLSIRLCNGWPFGTHGPQEKQLANIYLQHVNKSCKKTTIKTNHSQNKSYKPHIRVPTSMCTPALWHSLERNRQHDGNVSNQNPQVAAKCSSLGPPNLGKDISIQQAALGLQKTRQLHQGLN